MKTCRECGHRVSAQAFHCPGCGAPYPARERWDGWGFEYKSKATLLGWPLLHVSFKYRPNRMPVPAKGIIAIGQFAVGVVSIAQLGLGFFCLGQFAAGAYVIAAIPGENAIGLSTIKDLSRIDLKWESWTMLGKAGTSSG